MGLPTPLPNPPPGFSYCGFFWTLSRGFLSLPKMAVRRPPPRSLPKIRKKYKKYEKNTKNTEKIRKKYKKYKKNTKSQAPTRKGRKAEISFLSLELWGGIASGCHFSRNFPAEVFRAGAVGPACGEWGPRTSRFPGSFFFPGSAVSPSLQFRPLSELSLVAFSWRHSVTWGGQLRSVGGVL